MAHGTNERSQPPLLGTRLVLTCEPAEPAPWSWGSSSLSSPEGKKCKACISSMPFKNKACSKTRHQSPRNGIERAASKRTSYHVSFVLTRRTMTVQCISQEADDLHSEMTILHSQCRLAHHEPIAMGLLSRNVVETTKPSNHRRSRDCLSEFFNPHQLG